MKYLKNISIGYVKLFSCGERVFSLSWESLITYVWDGMAMLNEDLHI